MLKIVLFLVAAGCIASAFAQSSQDLNKFTTEEIVPDIIDAPPTKVAQVQYGDRVVNFGNELTPEQVKSAPSLTYDADPNKYYTLIMSDPDAPNRSQHKFRSWLHWLVVNIPGNNLASGEVLAQYNGSNPPKHMGLHRYVFTIFEQPGKLQFSERYPDKMSRPKFNVRGFAEKYQLGNPLAGNFFQAQNADN